MISSNSGIDISFKEPSFNSFVTHILGKIDIDGLICKQLKIVWSESVFSITLFKSIRLLILFSILISSFSNKKGNLLKLLDSHEVLQTQTNLSLPNKYEVQSGSVNFVVVIVISQILFSKLLCIFL